MLLRAAAEAAGAQRFDRGALYVVATPIGNLADLTLRAIHVLGQVDAVAAEDTRVAARLLAHLALARPLVALHAHNERDAALALCARLAAGQAVAYVSDAGTPAVSDPGARLVAAVAAAGHRVVPVPGPSSALAALAVAGDVHGEGFRFVGFLPSKGAERGAAIASLAAEPGTVVLFEAPHRIAALLETLAAQQPARRVTLARELTKQFETVLTRPAAELPGWLAGDGQRRRGEFVLVLHARAPAPARAAPAAEAPLDPAAERTLALLLAELPLKQAVALAGAISGAPRNALYARALALRPQ
ncbi:MAG: 16S rRNA (cytidine(1402)-2'-O)-methyltransferase [Proteobacteria bacterium]|nr:16S rRNA (cytidine(1402)-2'-O)-methyltransferase [Pseudomonadota bacterium]